MFCLRSLLNSFVLISRYSELILTLRFNCFYLILQQVVYMVTTVLERINNTTQGLKRFMAHFHIPWERTMIWFLNTYFWTQASEPINRYGSGADRGFQILNKVRNLGDLQEQLNCLKLTGRCQNSLVSTVHVYRNISTAPDRRSVTSRNKFSLRNNCNLGETLNKHMEIIVNYSHHTNNTAIVTNFVD